MASVFRSLQTWPMYIYIEKLSDRMNLPLIIHIYREFVRNVKQALIAFVLAA